MRMRLWLYSKKNIRFFRILLFLFVDLKIRLDVELIFLIMLLYFFIFVVSTFFCHEYFDGGMFKFLFSLYT